MTDTLSDVLRTVSLNGALFFSVDASEPWVVETPHASAVAPYILPSAEHVIDYHVVTSGACWGGVVGEPALRLEAGDVIAFPQGDAHVMSSAPGMRAPIDTELHRAAADSRLPVQISVQGGGREGAKLICGFLGCDARPFNPLLATLPRVIHVRGAGNVILSRLVELALAESTAPSSGSDCILAHLSELLFVEVVRCHVATLPPEQVGWLAGLRDEGVGRALHKLHERPAHAWSLEELAREVGMSRSVLAERFTHLVGIPPIQYLAQWRMQLAASLLRSSTATVAEIAQRIGYGSEAALSRAFKRWVGVAPSSYRRAAARR